MVVFAVIFNGTKKYYHYICSMKTTRKDAPHDIATISFDKLLSISKLPDNNWSYDEGCLILSVNDNSDNDIFKYPIRINAYIIVICSNGRIKLSCNLRHYKIEENTIFAYKPGMIIQLLAIESSDLKVVIFTQEFLDNLHIRTDNLPLQYKKAQECYSFLLSTTDRMELCNCIECAEALIGKSKTNPYYRTMVRASFTFILYELLYQICENSKDSHPNTMTQNSVHFETFMRLLSEHYKKYHSIRFYADKMCLTPKYLSMVIKRASGKLATEWIDEYVILEAKNLIKYSTMTIQEISNALNFPNQSFFSKYFKRLTGLTPKAYREQP